MTFLLGFKAWWARIDRDTKFIAGIVCACIAVLLIAYCSGKSAGKDKVKVDQLEREVDFQTQVGNATGNAADDRAAETILIDESESEAHNAIASAPDSAPSAAAVAHNCRRLRRAGRDTSRYPACKGH